MVTTMANRGDLLLPAGRAREARREAGGDSWRRYTMTKNEWLNVIGSFLLGASLTAIYGFWKAIPLAIAIIIIKEEIISRK